MKIEKLNEHQIRCTLTKEDLAARHIKLSELAYGTEKTRALFQDMMTQASMDFGFEADNIPLMVEAIPLPSEKVVLIITKVDSPDELDTRFSEFSQYFSEDDAPEVIEKDDFIRDDNMIPADLIDLFSQIKKELEDAADAADKTEAPAVPVPQVSLFAAADMDTAIRAAQAVAPFYQGDSSLYRETSSGEYLLLLHQGRHTPLEFRQMTHTLAAFLEKRSCSAGAAAFHQEHSRPILRRHAVQTLAQIS
ncbi:MAG: adaptor protein MecA [Clostridiales bacterium]|nr:adaptor protein MecA [Clostridiales bacterium]MCD8108843.1 adaptor protein MecA [Clostridiales bacterium]